MLHNYNGIADFTVEFILTTRILLRCKQPWVLYNLKTLYRKLDLLYHISYSDEGSRMIMRVARVNQADLSQQILSNPWFTYPISWLVSKSQKSPKIKTIRRGFFSQKWIFEMKRWLAHSLAFSYLFTKYWALLFEQ